jgi:hypothetical protein
MDSQDNITIAGPTVTGRYNVFGIEDDGFFLQGGMSLDQLDKLKRVLDDFLASVER